MYCPFKYLFFRFITLAHTQLESQDFATCLTLMLDRGTHFLAKLGTITNNHAEDKTFESPTRSKDSFGSLFLSGTWITVFLKSVM